MRKLCLSLLAISFFIMFFCGCNTENKTEINFDFTSTCSVEVNNIALTLDVISSGEDNVSIEVVSPPNMKGLKYERVNSSLYIDYNGLRCIASTDYLMPSNPFDILIDSLISINTTELKFMFEEGEYDIYNGKSENGEYTIFVDKSNGNIIKLKPLYSQYEFEFTHSVK